jgi:hypothetical protein
VKRITLWLFGLITLSGCGRLDTLLYIPQQTGQEWLASQPYMELELASHEFILVQPSSTFFVYLLGVLTIAFGSHFYRNSQNQLSRKWWGGALILWGIGALLAGTSYQAFSYEIKCAGQEYCLWTSWWEILYMIFSVASVNAMLLGVGHTSAVGKLREAMTVYAFANTAVYLAVILFGVFLPVKFLISFELMLIFLAPSILYLFFLSIGRYRKDKKPIDRGLIITWLWLGLTMVAYYTYLLLGFTEQLWQQGIWFSENDVLHVGLISWMVFIRLRLVNKIEDLPWIT